MNNQFNIVQLNSVCGIGSTGKICVGISKALYEHSLDNIVLYSFGESNYEHSRKYSSDIYTHIQAAQSHILGNYGFNSRISTRQLINALNEIQPKVLHIHNIHGHDCNLETLFDYIKKKQIKVIWTFHDCWPFTGYCTYFTECKCDKWKTECGNCTQKRKYSLIVDRSKKILSKKKQALSDIDITIVTPSVWLEKHVQQSFLKDNNTVVINNGINSSLFKPLESDFRIQYKCVDKFIILGVAFDWEERKGLDIFLDLADRLPERFQIVLVGTNNRIDKLLPRNIISIHRTNNAQELAQIYSAANLFVNATREENFPTVNIESLACGTPVLTADIGGSAEIIDTTSGRVVKKHNADEFEKEILNIENTNPFTEEMCVRRARLYDENDRFQEYVQLYKNVLGI